MENNKIEKFEDLTVWNEGLKLSEEIYLSLKNCNDFGFRDQIRRAAVSIPSNIAEGGSRESEKDYNRFLQHSLGSSYELETQLLIAKAVKYGDDTLRSKMLLSFMSKLNK